MGREIKRVPLDFDWPLKKVWEGFRNPYYKYQHECDQCHVTGYNRETYIIYKMYGDHEACQVVWDRFRKEPFSEEEIHEILSVNLVDDLENPGRKRKGWTYQYGIGLDGKPAERPPHKIVGDYRGWKCSVTQEEVDWAVQNKPFNFINYLEYYDKDQKKYVPHDPPPKITAAFVNETNEIAHITHWDYALVMARATLRGVYGLCENCNGEGRVWEAESWKYLAEKYQNIPVPEGEGYQVWETVTEGSPVSPVFKTKDELIVWLVSQGTSLEGAKAFAESEWVPSLIISNGEMKANYEAATGFGEKSETEKES